MHARNKRPWIAPEERDYLDAFLQTDRQPLVLWPRQPQIDAERIVGESASVADFLACRLGRSPRQSQHPETAGIADRSGQGRARRTTHRGLHDGKLNAEESANLALHHDP